MKEKLANSINKSLQDYLNTEVDEKFDKTYLGIVEDNNDPLKHGRVRVRLHGLYDDIPTHALPWSTPNFPLGAGGKKGSFIVPELGAVVNVTFDNADIYEPKYSDKCLDVTNLKFDADKDEDYPNSVIFYETSNGDYCKINRKKGEYTLKTGAGVLIKTHENGDIEISNESSENGALNVKLNGDILIDNRTSNTNIITNNHYTSAFGDIEVKSNAGIKEECLDDREMYSNNDMIFVAGNTTKLKSKENLELGSKTTTIRTNEIEIKPALSTFDTTYNKSTGLPETYTSGFKYSVCEDTAQTPFIFVEPCYQGGPFNALLFDTFTGAPHQGRVVKSELVLKGKDTVDIEKQKAELTIKIKAKYAKLKTRDLAQLTKSYASIDSQAQMLVNNLNASFTETKKAKEIKDINDYYDKLEQEELDLVLDSIDGYLINPIYGTTIDINTPEGKRVIYNAKIPGAEVTAKADPSMKTIAKDIIGSGDGLIKDDIDEQ